MFERVHIDGFRGMDDVHVGPFGRINLIVGPGGTAKTSLLEALFIHCSGGRANLLTMALQQRGIETPYAPGEIRRLYDGFFSAGATPGQAQIKGSWSGLNRTTRLTSAAPRILPLEDIDPVTLRSRDVSIRPLLSYEIATITGELSVTARLHLTSQGPPLPEPGRGGEIPARFHGARTGRSKDLASLWTRAEDSGEADELVELLGRIDPEIRGVRIGSSEAGSAFLRISHTRMGHVDEPELLGGWLRATLGHLLALVDVRSGILLVDEFDGPLHVSALAEVARYIGEAARRLDVQVFLTTHREEAVDAFLDQDALAPDVSVLRASRHDGAFRFEALNSGEARYLRDDVGVDLRRTV